MCNCQCTDKNTKTNPNHLNFTKNALHVCSDRNLYVGGLEKSLLKDVASFELWLLLSFLLLNSFYFMGTLLCLEVILMCFLTPR